MRILQIVENLDRGAVENWLVSACEVIADLEPSWEWTFYCVLGECGRLDERAQRLGAKIVYSPYPLRDKRRFMASMRSFMRSNPHDVLHCHHDVMSAVYLWAALGLPFDKRIVHVHNASQTLPTPSRWKNKLLKRVMRQTCLQLTDKVVAISEHTLMTFLSGARRYKSRDQIVPVGVDTGLFRANPDPAGFRQQLGLAESSKVMLFVGRMVTFKNPLFLLEILQVIAEHDSSVVACFVGEGPLKAELWRLAEQKELSDRVRLLGWRDDIASVMQSSDILVFPNHEEVKEGLGLVVIEAQAAGLPMLLSLGATQEAIVVPDLSTVLPLHLGATLWADKAVELMNRERTARNTFLDQVEASPLSLASSASALFEIYR